MAAQIWRVAVLALCLLVTLSFALSGTPIEAIAIATVSCLWFISRLRPVDSTGAGTLYLRRKALIEGLQMFCLSVLMLTAVALTFAIVFLGWTRTTEGRLLDLALVGVVVLLKRELERHDKSFHKLWRGIHAEDAVAESLDEVRQRGWEVVDSWMRDDGYGNVDHAVRGPNRTFAIETKSYDKVRNADLAQAVRNAIWLKGQWGAPWVDAVLCIDKPGYEPERRLYGTSPVWVADRRDLSGWLIERDAMPPRTRPGSS